MFLAPSAPLYLSLPSKLSLSGSTSQVKNRWGGLRTSHVEMTLMAFICWAFSMVPSTFQASSRLSSQQLYGMGTIMRPPFCGGGKEDFKMLRTCPGPHSQCLVEPGFRAIALWTPWPHHINHHIYFIAFMMLYKQRSACSFDGGNLQKISKSTFNYLHSVYTRWAHLENFGPAEDLGSISVLPYCKIVANEVQREVTNLPKGEMVAQPCLNQGVMMPTRGSLRGKQLLALLCREHWEKKHGSEGRNKNCWVMLGF